MKVTEVASTEKAGDAARVRFEPYVFTSAANDGATLPYLVAKPGDWNPKQKHPLLLFLHGAGERDTDNKRQLTWGRAWMEQAVTQFHAIVLAPQCPPDRRWVEVDWSLATHDTPKEMSQPMRLLFELLPVFEKEYSIDPARRYISGLSMGGYGTWDALSRRPDYFAAAAVICGGADEKQAAAIAKVPVWVFHGSDDGAVSVNRSRNIVAALRKAGGKPRYTEYPGVGHSSWDNAFVEPELLNWLFRQKR